ncbi:hypothetical protein DFH06DRAFT_1130623 [Mycena polygramma]|nr:hypothetical protein DFH06DRAFT_1130623 [Mycena polygramma]
MSTMLASAFPFLRTVVKLATAFAEASFSDVNSPKSINQINRAPVFSLTSFSRQVLLLAVCLLLSRTPCLFQFRIKHKHQIPGLFSKSLELSKPELNSCSIHLKLFCLKSAPQVLWPQVGLFHLKLCQAASSHLKSPQIPDAPLRLLSGARSPGLLSPIPTLPVVRRPSFISTVAAPGERPGGEHCAGSIRVDTMMRRHALAGHPVHRTTMSTDVLLSDVAVRESGRLPQYLLISPSPVHLARAHEVVGRGADAPVVHDRVAPAPGFARSLQARHACDGTEMIRVE